MGNFECQAEVVVARTATIAELKEAVEVVFSQLPRDTHINISWYGPHCSIVIEKKKSYLLSLNS